MVPVLANHQITAQDFLLALGDAEKFSDIHVAEAPVLAQVAAEYAGTYSGRFPFMCEMRQKATWGLSPKQAAAVLNCLKAEVVREQQAPAVQPCVASLVSLPAFGIYTLSNSSDDYVTLRIRPVDNKPGLAAIAEYLDGPMNTTDYRSYAWVTAEGQPRVWASFRRDTRIVRALQALLSADSAQRHAYGFAYAQASGRCMVCGRVLTTPESIASGIGPTCAGRDN